MPNEKRRRPVRLSLERKRNYKGYIFVAPLLLGLLAVFIPALVKAVRFSFSDIVITQTGYELQAVQWKHYHNLLFVDAYFVRNIAESVLQLLLQIILVLIYSLLIAVILNRKLPGRGFFRAILFLPILISTGVVTMADAGSLTTVSTELATSGEGFFGGGGLENMLTSLQLGDSLTNIITAAVNNIYGIVTSSGIQLVIFLAGLQSISPAIYESAKVEGATWWETFWKITIPMISPIILVNTVYTVVDSFVSSTNPVMNTIYNTIMTNADFSMGSAMVLLYFLVVAAALAIAMGVANRFVYYEN